jgi:beta-glucosidase
MSPRVMLLTTLTALAPAVRAQDDLDARVDALLARMTLEEKVGQMTQVELGVVSAGEGGRGEPHALDLAKLRAAVVEHHVGSILNVINHAYTPDHWRAVVAAIQAMAAETRLGIPVLYGIDAVHGANYTLGGTVFPQNIALAAAFDPALVEAAAAVTAAETRASAIPWNFAPVLDLGRQPLWPRFYETFGEDVLVTRRLGAAAVRGLEGDDLADPTNVAACLKHYVGYSFPLSGKDRTTAWIPERYLREYFLPPFQDAIEAGARSVMVNSGDVNGVPVHASRYLLTDVLRGELGFDGVVVTDWRDVQHLHRVHRVAPTEREAVRMAVEAGVDVSMVPYDFTFAEHLAALVRDGEVAEERVDASVRRILRLKLELGLFDDPMGGADEAGAIGTAEAAALNLRAARAAMTLLKNDGAALPLAPGARVLVTGPAAHSLTALNGGWTYTWQGQDSTYAASYPEAPTVLEAVRAAAGAERVTYVPGTPFTGEVDGGIDAAAEAARTADVVVVVLGEDAYAEKPGDLDALDLPAAQLRLAEAVAATGTPTVLVLVEGRPRIVTPAVAAADAVLMAYQPGMAGGRAVADALFGAVNPSGRLPFTYPKFSGDLVPYDHTNAAGTGQQFGGIGQVAGYDPLFPFGHGLSYTTFAYRDLAVSAPVNGQSDRLTVSVTVENTGAREGEETVLLFVRDLYASVAPPVQRLRAFDRVRLEPGASQRVTFTLDRQDLAFVGEDDAWTVEPGDFEVRVGGLTGTFTLR